MLTRARTIYRETRKPVDNFWTAYISRPPAALLVALLEPTPITPNQITLLSFLVGILSALLLALLPGWPFLILGVLLFQLAYILDCADGMLARARRVASPQGHLLDFLMDELKALAFFGAISLRLYFASKDELYLLLGVLGEVALASGLSLTTFTRRPEIASPAPASPQPERQSLTRRLLRQVEAGARFLIHYPSYVLYLALFDRIDIYFFAYLGVNTLYAARTFVGVALKAARENPSPVQATPGEGHTRDHL